MEREYHDSRISFHVPSVVPSRFKVTASKDGDYSIHFRNGIITISLVDPTERIYHLKELEQQSNLNRPGLLVSNVTKDDCGANVCHIQETHSTADPSVHTTEIRVLIDTPEACLSVVVSISQDVQLRECRDFLSSVSWHGSPTRPELVPQGDSDQGKWKRALRRAIQTARKEPPAIVLPRRMLMIFADNYQFCFYDLGRDPLNPPPSIGDDQARDGWAQTANGLWFFPRAHGNRHRVDLGVVQQYYDDPAAERVHVHNFNVSSGRVAILNHEDDSVIDVTAGWYSVYLFSYNIGKDCDQAMSDEEWLQRMDLERYTIALVPGKAAKQGVIRGPRFLQ